MGLVLRNVQVDVAPEAHGAAVAYWAAALGGTARAVDGPYHHLDGVRSPVGLHVQRLDEAGTGGYHLDLQADDVEGQATRLVDLGATDLGAAGGWEDGTRLLADPAGLRFCITRAGQPQLLDGRREDAHLHLVVLDLPGEVRDAAVAFWAAAFGTTAEPVRPPFEAYTWLGVVPTTGGGVGVLVQAVGDGDPSRIHLDLHVPTAADRDREVARLSGLGAERVAAHGHWQVLRAPGGHLHCVVPDEH